jgi:amino acid adenylation domain-containing protein
MTDPLREIDGLTPKQLALLELRLRRSKSQPRPAAPRRARTEPAPLSFAQRRLWFLHQLDPGRSDYHIHGALRLSGFLEVPALEGSLREIVRRHEALRTTFHAEAGEPVQVVQPPPAFVLPVTDLSGLDAETLEQELRVLVAAEGLRPFDLAAELAWRFRLLRERPERHILVATLHHIVADDWSLQVFLHELGALYGAFAAGRPSPLPELPLQYPDFALWQRQHLQGKVLERELEYWRQRLAGPLPTLRLAPGRGAAAPRSRPGVVRRPLPRALAAGLAELSCRRGVTLFMTLLAVFKGLLFHLTRQDDLLVGTTVAERNRPETEGLIGFLVNILVLRTDLAGNPDFLDLLGRVRETVLGALAHQDLPFDKLVQEIQPDRDVERFPLVQVGFELFHPLGGDLSLPGLEVAMLDVEDRTVRGELLLQVEEGEDGLLCALEYDGALFDPAEAERLLARFARLAELVVEDPERPVKLLPLLREEIAEALGIEASRIDKIAPLNPTQRDIYLGHLRDPEATTYVLGLSIHFPLPLDPDLWRRALERVAAPEEALRTRLSSFRGEVFQILDRQARLSFEMLETDLASGTPGLDRLVDGVVRRPMDLHGETLFRHGLVRAAGGDCTAVLRVHHILFDGFSAHAFFGRAAAVYEDLAAGGEPRLPASGSFYDAVGESLGRADTPAVEAYWTDHLAGVVPLQGLAPHAEPAPVIDRRSLSGDFLREIRDFCARQGCRLPSFLLAVYGALLGRLYQPEGDFVVHNLFSARRKGPYLRTLGCFFQVLPVVFRDRVAGEGSVPELLDEVDGYRRALGPMENVSMHLQKRLLRDGGLRFFYNYYRFGLVKAFGGGRLLRDHVSFTPDEVHLIARDTGEEVELELFSDAHQLRDRGFLDRLVSLAAQMARGVERLGDLDLLSAAERGQVLHAWNDTAEAFPQAASVVELFETQAARAPESVAVADRERRLTYRELAGQAGRVAARLAAAGAGPETVVGLLARRGNGFLAAVLGVFKAGAAYLPLDPRHPSARWSQMLDRAGCSLVLVSRELREALARPRLLVLEECLEDTTPAAPPRPALDPRHLAYVIFTSGSTGVPKGAMLEQRGMLNHLWIKVAELGLGPEDAVAQSAAQSFDISVWQLLAPLLVGARVEVLEDEIAFDGTRLLPEAARRGVTVLETVPSLLRAILDVGDLPELPRLRWLMATGEALPPDLCRGWLARHPGIPLVNAYGPTECSDDVTHHVIREAPAPPEALIPIGRPLANLRLHLLDRGLRPVPAAATGELYVGGAGVGRGYLGDPAATARAFVPDPFSAAPGERLYRTGDLARRRPGGELEFLGRLDHQVKIRGARIELGEIEAALLRQPGIAQCAVVAREGPAGAYLAAYVVGRGPARPDGAALAAALRRELPEAMVPSAFVPLEALPLTPNGKLDRSALPEPESARPGGERGRVAPRDELERQLAALWEDLLEVRPVGVTDSFFDLGGESLLAVRLMAHIKSRFGRDLPLATLFAGPTIETLADLLRRDSVLIPSPLVALQPRGTETPLFCIHPGSGDILCYFDLVGALGRGRPVYGLQDPVLWGGWSPGVPLPEMAARYVEEVRRAWPEGPYLLCGWSFGGQVAFEMARQLRRAGAEVPFLGILDTPAPLDVEEYAASLDDAYYLAVIAAESQAPLRRNELQALGEEAQVERVVRAIQEAGAGFPGLDADWVRFRFALFKSRIEMLRRYEPGVFAGRITLFRAHEADPEEPVRSQTPSLGWEALTAAGVDVHVVPGTHATMGQEPQVRELAARLAACLETADGGGERP